MYRELDLALDARENKQVKRMPCKERLTYSIGLKIFFVLILLFSKVDSADIQFYAFYFFYFL